ncbi:MAG TPA: zinc metallopeptidase [Tissierellaceae bacterium]|nr:zinc metallopeptidase [Tissierellaceae bacterium]
MYGLGYGMYMDSTWFIFVLPALLLGLFAQSKVKGAYNKYSKQNSDTGLTGAQIARRILDRNGLYDVVVEQTAGQLTDHYDPRNRIMRLSNHIYGGSSVASMSVAAHEAGHALQHADGYFPLIIRNNLAPIVNFTSRFVWVFILLGFLISPFLIEVGIALFLGVVLFQVITLPVELNASKRALAQLEDGISPRENLKPAKSMLSAAALTYVAATLTAIAELLRLLAIANRRRD